VDLPGERGIRAQQQRCSRLLTVTTTLRQQCRDVWEFLEQDWIAYHRGGVMQSLLSDP